MGERQVSLFRTNFNRSIRVQAASTPLTEDAGALALRADTVSPETSLRSCGPLWGSLRASSNSTGE